MDLIERRMTRALIVLADIVGSRRYTPSTRRGLQRRILAALGFDAAFRTVGGDEFEWRLPDSPHSWDRLLQFRLALAVPEGSLPGVHLRVGLGRGEVTVVDEISPYAEDGPAYHRARDAMNELRDRAKRRRRDPAFPLRPAGKLPARTSLHDGTDHPVRHALLAHMDSVYESWSEAQLVALARVAQGQTYAEIGEALGISMQAVSQRVSASRWDLFLEAHAAVRAAW